MKIAILSPELPWPADNGTRIDLYERLRWFLEQGCELHYIWIGNGRLPDSFRECPLRFEPIPVRADSRWQCPSSPALVARIQVLIDNFEPDVLWVEYADFAHLVAALSHRVCPVWFRSHNFELAHGWEKGTRRPGKNGGPSIRLRTRIAEGWRIFRTEWRMYRVADRVFHIGHADLTWMRRLYVSRRKPTWLPPWLAPMSGRTIREAAPLEVVYLGSSFDHVIESHAAHTLISEIIPAVRRSHPARFRFHLIGRHGDRLWGDHAAPDLQIHGFVADLPTLLREMDVACFPVTLGWGCKIKAAEMFACGIPVIAAPRVFAGFDAMPRGAVMACRSTHEYVHSLLEACDPTKRTEMARSARDTYGKWMATSRTLLRRELDSLAKNSLQS